MATARFTVGAVLDTVNVTAATITTSLNSVSKTVGMFNALVDKAANEQRKRYAIEAEELDEKLIHEAADARAEQRKIITTKLSSDPLYAQHYEEARNDYRAILNRVNGVSQPKQGTLRMAAE